MPEFDKIIRNGTIIDGTGGMPAYRGDIAIKNGNNKSNVIFIKLNTSLFFFYKNLNSI